MLEFGKTARIRWFLRWIALSAVLLICDVTAAAAGGFQLTPMLVEIPQDKSVATYQVRNTGREDLHLQISAWAWQQNNNNNHYTEAKSLLIVPSIMTVAPGQERLVRVALRKNRRPESELAYRLHFDEIPPQKTMMQSVGVRTAVSFNVPLFFLADQPNRRFRINSKLAKSKKAVIVEVKNTGSKFVRISEFTVLDSNGARIAHEAGPHYALPGDSRQWRLGISPTISIRNHPGPYTLIIRSESGQRKIALQTE